ncbi:MAG: cupredoxin domain-containing protein [Nanoarchaeota archaeon]|nr:cupredoxin domain-containing protein [Nanoarchaeota archaeon]
MENDFICEECNRDFSSEDALRMHNAAKHSSLNEKKKGLSKKSIITIAIIVIILISGYQFVNNTSGKNTNSNVINDNNKQDKKDSPNTSINNEIQKITLSFKDYNYYPNTLKVKLGVPVEITLDSTIRGCFRSFNIRSLGISGHSSNPSQKITFTPNKKGSFEFACSMRMAYGTIIVE